MNELEKVIPRQHEIAGLERKLQHHRWKSRVTLPPEKKKHKLDDTLVAKGETTNDMQNKSRFSRSQTVKLHSGQEHRKKVVTQKQCPLNENYLKLPFFVSVCIGIPTISSLAKFTTYFFHTLNNNFKFECRNILSTGFFLGGTATLKKFTSLPTPDSSTANMVF